MDAEVDTGPTGITLLLHPFGNPTSVRLLGEYVDPDTGATGVAPQYAPIGSYCTICPAEAVQTLAASAAIHTK